MPEFKQVFADGSRRFPRPHKLGKMYGQESEIENIHCRYLFGTSGAVFQPAGVAFSLSRDHDNSAGPGICRSPAIRVAGKTKPKLEVVLRGVFPLVMVNHHPEVLYSPLGMFC